MSMMRISLILLAILNVSGCLSQPVPVVNCTVAPTKLLDQAFGDVREKLANKACHYQFDQYFDYLLSVSEGNPGKDNRLRFSDFMTYANERGVLNTVQTKEYFSRYFSTKFVSLSDKYNTCGAGKFLARIEQELTTELSQKRRGLQLVLGDDNAYKRAINQKEGVLLLLDATTLACGTQSS